MRVEDEMEVIVTRLLGPTGVGILKESYSFSPDMVIEKDGKRIGIEFKSGVSSSTISRGIGQLLFGKVTFGLDELWLVFPRLSHPQPFYLSWFKTLEYAGITPYFLGQVQGQITLQKIEEKDCEPWGKVEWFKAHRTDKFPE